MVIVMIRVRGRYYFAPHILEEEMLGEDAPEYLIILMKCPKCGVWSSPVPCPLHNRKENLGMKEKLLRGEKLEFDVECPVCGAKILLEITKDDEITDEEYKEACRQYDYDDYYDYEW